MVDRPRMILLCLEPSAYKHIWVAVKIMVAFWVLNIIRHLGT